MSRLSNTRKKQRHLSHLSQIPLVLFVMGAPGSGKSTQSERIAREFNCLHLCVGDLLRREAEFRGAKIAEKVREGQLVATAIVMDILKREMGLNPGRNFVIDDTTTEAGPTDLGTMDQEAIDVEAMYRVELARPIRLSGIALHPNDPDVIVSGKILETIRAAVTTFTRL